MDLFLLAIAGDIAGDIAADLLTSTPDFQVYLQLYCQAVKQGCTSAAYIGIRASDIAFPSVTLPDGTEYNYIYLVSCSGKVGRNAAGTAMLQCIDMAAAPMPSCAEKHASINAQLGFELRYGIVRAADVEQYKQVQQHPSGLFNAATAFNTAVVQPHAVGLCKGPALHTVKASHISAAAKRHVLGRGQPQATLLLDFQRRLYRATSERIASRRLRPAVSLCLYALVHAVHCLLQDEVLAMPASTLAWSASKTCT